MSQTATSPPPVFSKVIAASIAAAVTPVLVRWLADQLGLFIDEENARRALVTAITLATTFAAGFLKSEPVRNVRRYLEAKGVPTSSGAQEPTRYDHR